VVNRSLGAFECVFAVASAMGLSLFRWMSLPRGTGAKECRHPAVRRGVIWITGPTKR
jgi:hypothetical protein